MRNTNDEVCLALLLPIWHSGDSHRPLKQLSQAFPVYFLKGQRISGNVSDRLGERIVLDSAFSWKVLKGELLKQAFL